VENWLGGDSRELSAVITEERVRCITRMTKQLTSELEVEGNKVAGIDSLRQAMQKLDAVLARTA
jgi:hypothetical protein